jgi:putative transcriptional regulator
MEGSTRGRLLVATPGLDDPNFSRTVVFVLEHNDEGAFGIVLNRPADADLREHFPRWAGVIAEPPVAFAGGPVSPDSLIALALGDSPTEAEGWSPLLTLARAEPDPAAAVGTVDLAVAPSDLGVGIEAVRVFAGYAGWSPGQLEGEIDVGGWWVLDATADDPFAGHPGNLWSDVLRRQRGTIALYADCPPDPSVN